MFLICFSDYTSIICKLSYTDIKVLLEPINEEKQWYKV